MAEFKTKFHQV